MALVWSGSGSFEAGVGYRSDQFALHFCDRRNDDAMLLGMGEAALAIPSVLSENCISKPSGTWLWDWVDGLIQIKN